MIWVESDIFGDDRGGTSNIVMNSNVMIWDNLEVLIAGINGGTWWCSLVSGHGSTDFVDEGIEER